MHKNLDTLKVELGPVADHSMDTLSERMVRTPSLIKCTEHTGESAQTRVYGTKGN